MLIRIFFLLGLLICPTLFAEVQLYVVKPTKHHYNYVIPVRTGITVGQALLEYKKQILLQPELARLFSPEQLTQLSLGQAKRLNERGPEKVLLLANRGYDYEGLPGDEGENRIRKVIENLGSSKNIYVLPIAAAIGLNPADTTDFYAKLNRHFTGVIALGGSDVSPDLYGDEKTHSRDVNLMRDFYEIEFLKAWIHSEKGFLYGICRGHQLIAAALGFKLIQHVDDHGDRTWQKHSIQLTQTRANHFQNIFGRNVKQLAVNSYHHQAVRYARHPEVQVAAIAPDGSVEALESFDGRILTTQFHPEFMRGPVAKNIFNYIKQQTRRFSPNKCVNLFK